MSVENLESLRREKKKKKKGETVNGLAIYRGHRYA
jgi:hypothetical protein